MQTKQTYFWKVAFKNTFNHMPAKWNEKQFFKETEEERDKYMSKSF